jgi:hypothetical protein
MPHARSFLSISQRPASHIAVFCAENLLRARDCLGAIDAGRNGEVGQVKAEYSPRLSNLPRYRQRFAIGVSSPLKLQQHAEKPGHRKRDPSVKDPSP